MADDIILAAETGRPTGSAASRPPRATGRTPAVLYGRGADPAALTVDWRELRAALTTDKGLNALLTVKVDGKSTKAVVKELQRHPVRRDVLHVDFLAVDVDVAITTDVPIVIEGEATKVLREQGIVDQVLSALVISAKPDAIPGHIPVDVSDLEIGHTLRVGDLAVPRGGTPGVDPDETALAAQVPGRGLGEEGEAAEEAEAAGAGEEEAGDEARAEGGDAAGDAGDA